MSETARDPLEVSIERQRERLLDAEIGECSDAIIAPLRRSLAEAEQLLATRDDPVERYEGHGNLDLTVDERKRLRGAGFEPWGMHGWIRDDENGETCYDDKWAMREAESHYPVVQCPICGSKYVLPQDGDPSRRCPTCGSPAKPYEVKS